MKRFWRCLCLGYVLLFPGCKPSENAGKEINGKATTAGSTISKAPFPAAKRKQMEARLKWNMATLVGDYNKKGTRNSKWDHDANEALATFARVRAYGPEQVPGFPTNVAALANAAVGAGCTDPLIKYLHARFALESSDTNEIATILKDIYFSLLQSDYSAVRKFYAGVRAVEARYRISGRPRAENPDSIAGWNMFKRAQQELHEVLGDKTAPAEEVDEACHQYLYLASRLTGDLDFVFGRTEPLLFSNWSKDSFAHLFKGEVYILYAWAVRGSGTAEKVKPEGWQGFAERLAVAEAALEQAWKLDPTDPRIAKSMMELELGQGKGRDRMELWFQRAMEIAPNNYDACKAKLYYLEPKWYGSADDMLRFGRECVASEKWIGSVPLVLVEAHDTLAKYAQRNGETNYWQRTEVWPDLKASFEKFFLLNPQASSWRHNYARYAYWCQQWDALNEQLKLLGEVNYDYFGGRSEFDQMVKLAAQHASNPVPDPKTKAQ